MTAPALHNLPDWGFGRPVPADLALAQADELPAIEASRSEIVRAAQVWQYAHNAPALPTAFGRSLQRAAERNAADVLDNAVTVYLAACGVTT